MYSTTPCTLGRCFILQVVITGGGGLGIITVNQQGLETGIRTEAAKIGCMGRLTFVALGRNNRDYMYIQYPNYQFELWQALT